MRVFDVFTSVPTPERVALEIRSWGGEAGYVSMFGARWSKLLGLQPETIAWVAGLERDDFLDQASSRLSDELPPVSDFIDQLTNAGITKAIVHRTLPIDIPTTDESTARLVAEFPKTLVGFARIDLNDGPARAAELLEQSVTTLGLRGATYTPFWHATACDDDALAPVLLTAQRLGVPIWIHTSMHWRRAVPLEIEHPRHIDVIAGRYPDLRIICGHGGWPWIQDIVAVAWRHPNVYIDISAFRPRHIFQAGTGWEALVRYGEKVISDSIVYGSTWSLLGLTPQEAISEASSVPWPDDVKQRWLYDNMATLLNMED
jgi:predicted TIM-barrel fold metal-dependent hydrolase